MQLFMPELTIFGDFCIRPLLVEKWAQNRLNRSIDIDFRKMDAGFGIRAPNYLWNDIHIENLANF